MCDHLYGDCQTPYLVASKSQAATQIVRDEKKENHRAKKSNIRR